MPTLAIALHNDFADWEPALLMAAARGYLGAKIVTASPDGGPVTSMGGLSVTPDLAYADLDPAACDALVIPGGLAWEKGNAPDFAPLVRAFRANGKVVAGICAAASALAGSGVLDDVAHTGNALGSHQRQPGYQGASLYRDQPQAVSDKGIVTASGNAPHSFAVEVLKAVGLWSAEAQAEMAGFSAEHR
ncbi:DJ-1/PfpI family protein [Rhizobium halophytocola]|uniref:Intracellular protease/amidase n=1 Tax=Rhizobium halophytocola TaxID=735519 RepID=A0ABS4DWU5_9HYPH|nr:DJ-1/PfpI family protein [Rhizobium halophytocola]MBP1850170.1 putative intracellular protease/amidase [Rhizobium halophytocola]